MVDQYRIEYENAVLDLHKKYDLRNITVVLKPPPKKKNQEAFSLKQQNAERSLIVTQAQPLRGQPNAERSLRVTQSQPSQKQQTSAKKGKEHTAEKGKETLVENKEE